MAKKIRYVKDELRDYLIKKFLKRCKDMHALAFFKWRIAFNQNTDQDSLVEIFEDRIRFLKDHKVKQAENIELAEKADDQEEKAENEETDSPRGLPPPDILRYRCIKKALAEQDEKDEKLKEEQEMLEWE